MTDRCPDVHTHPKCKKAMLIKFKGNNERSLYNIRKMYNCNQTLIRLSVS